MRYVVLVGISFILVVLGCNNSTIPEEIQEIDSVSSFSSSVNDESSSSSILNESSSERSLESSSDAQGVESSDTEKLEMSSDERGSSELGLGNSLNSSVASSDSGSSSPEIAMNSSTDISSSSELLSSSSSLPHYENHDNNFPFLFDQNTVRTFNILLDPDSLAYLDNNPWDEDYVEGHLVFEGDTIQKVGVRYKGSFGAFSPCTNGRPGSKKCTKLSWKIKFSWDNDSKGRRFYGQKKIMFHSMNNYEDYLKEKLGYWILNESNVPAPRTAHVRILVNNALSGLYLMVENVDSRFAKNHTEALTNDGGNFYKETTPLMLNGQPYPAYVHVAGLRSNSSTGDVSGMVQFGEELKNATGDEIKAVLSRWLNVKSVTTSFALARALGQTDGPWYWKTNRYTHPSWWYEVVVPSPGYTNHNYFFYEDLVTNTFYFMLWDLDYSFRKVAVNDNLPNPNAGWVYPCGLGAEPLDMMCDKFTAGVLLFKEEYKTAVAEYLDEIYPQISGKLELWASQIESHVLEAANHHNDAPSVGDWNVAVNSLKAKIEESRNMMETFR